MPNKMPLSYIIDYQYFENIFVRLYAGMCIKIVTVKYSDMIHLNLFKEWSYNDCSSIDLRILYFLQILSALSVNSL